MTEASPAAAPPPPAAPPRSEPAAISVRHLWHRYGSLDVLRDVSFDVARGEIFGFIGPNGAGKTTTIRAMATLLEPMAGRVQIEGIDVSIDPDEVRRIIGFMPDHAGVYERITIREYLEFFADAYHLPDRAVVDAVIELTDLNNLQDRLVAALSKGMKQRLQVARILLHDPRVLILDEPASDLDPRARIEIRDLLLELRELGKTIFLSSHILTELSDICTSVGILERGRLVVAGPIQEISERLQAQRAAASPHGATPQAATGLHGATPQAAIGPQWATPQAAAGPHGATPPPAASPPAATATPQSTGEASDAVEANVAAPYPDSTSPPPSLEQTAGGATIPAASRRRLRLRVLGDPAGVAPLLAGSPNIFGAEPGAGGLLTIHYAGDERFVAEVVRYLVSRGVGIVAVEPERNELERIFLEATRGELQ